MTAATFGAPVVPEGVDVGNGSTPAQLGIVVGEAVDERLARHDLHGGVQRGANRKPTFVERLLAEHLAELTADFLGKVVGGEDRRAGGALLDAQWFFLRLFAIGSVDVAVLDHAVDYPVAAFQRAVGKAEWIVVVGALGERREIRRLGESQLMYRLVEVGQRGGGDAVGAEAEENFVQIELEDLVLGVGLLDAQRQDRLLDLAVPGLVEGQQEVPRHLLGDGRGADETLALAVGFHVLEQRAGDAVVVEAGVLVEILVLGRDERVPDLIGNRLNGEIESALCRVLGDQLAVGGVDAAHHRRLVLGEHVVVRQVLGHSRDVPGNSTSSGEEEHGTNPEQVADES